MHEILKINVAKMPHVPNVVWLLQCTCSLTTDITCASSAGKLTQGHTIINARVTPAASLALHKQVVTASFL